MFAGFDPYKMTGVRVTDRKVGHGSYATVLELEYVGLKCAGKKIHEQLLEQGDTSYTVRRFEEECRLLSQVRHPNIVQFLGVHFQEGVRAPILVMEFLPMTLASCIEQHGILPNEISYSILHDVALGLFYLHSQTPPIIHRDLSSNNVLLTPNMTAKISDLGVARILNLTPLQVSRMTQTPGTPAYMPPEVMVAKPKYDTSIDEFSYGILMIHMFSGSWPEPQVGQIRTQRGKLIPVSEAERREVFLHVIGNDHPLMDLIHRCINNDPQLRPHVNQIVCQIGEIATQFSTSFANRLEMLRHIEAVVGEKRALIDEGERKERVIQRKDNEISVCKQELQTLTEEIMKKYRDIQQKDNEISICRRELQALTEELEKMYREIQQKEAEISSIRAKFQVEKEYDIAEIDRLKVMHSSEVEQLQLQVRDLNAQSQLMKTENEAKIAELKYTARALETQIENSAKLLLKVREQSARRLGEEREQYEIRLRKERQYSDLQIAKEREANRKLIVNYTKLQSEVNAVRDINSKLQSDIIKRDSTIQMKDASTKRKDSENEARSRALEEKDAIISAMNEQLTKAREYLTTTQQVRR